MMMLNVPATVGLIVLAAPIVRVIFEHGEFTAARHAGDRRGAAASTRIGLVGYSVVRIASPTFYALGKNRIPVIVSIVTVLVNAVAERRCSCDVMGYRGLALGTSIAALFNATSLLVLLRRDLGGLNERRLLASFAAHRRWRRRRWGPPRSRPIGWLATALPGDSARLRRSSASRVDDRRRARGAGRSRRGLLRIREFNEGAARWCCGGSATRADEQARVRFGLHRHGRWCWPARTSSSTATATSSRRCCRCSSPQLNLSLAGAGTLQMCFQLANSVSQLGFGHLADRWRPRVLLLGGPLVGVGDAAARSVWRRTSGRWRRC